MRKLSISLAVLASVVAATVTPARAVTGNFTEDNVHDYVGLVAFYDAEGNFLWRCTGSLVNSTTVLTAGHCTDVKGGAVTAIFWASQEGGAGYDAVNDIEDPLTGYPYECLDSPEYPCATASKLTAQTTWGRSPWPRRSRSCRPRWMTRPCGRWL